MAGVGLGVGRPEARWVEVDSAGFKRLAAGLHDTKSASIAITNIHIENSFFTAYNPLFLSAIPLLSNTFISEKLCVRIYSEKVKSQEVESVIIH
jgi:hypothetical protein